MNEHIRERSGAGGGESLRAPINHCNNRPISRYLQTREHVFAARTTRSVLTHLDSSTFARPFCIKSSEKPKLRGRRPRTGCETGRRTPARLACTYEPVLAHMHTRPRSPAAHGNVRARDCLGVGSCRINPNRQWGYKMHDSVASDKINVRHFQVSSGQSERRVAHQKKNFTTRLERAGGVATSHGHVPRRDAATPRVNVTY
ncbi:jg19537 [Pararge aegeria aegeria]|uniref:Jg19537 protein n=1 Tax=Pararge aegeria aegeria TaxID=348720 RepID=A0A8S4R830_9NEOP|nr:jg19537 [Pararge aegeria aegeria]